MRHTTLACLLAAGLLPACGTTTPAVRTAPAPAAAPAPAPAAIAAAPATPRLFVAEPDAASQLVFVGQVRPDRIAQYPGAVFVPFSTYSVVRDGIPNEFPAPDTLAALLAAAGVHGGRYLIVGDPIPAGRAYAAFDYLGWGDRAALLDGGPGALPVPRPAEAPAASHPAIPPVQVRPDMIVDAAWVHARLQDPDVAILDARPPAEFSGATPGDGVERPGHIPGARNVFWQTLVHSQADPRLKSDAELRRIFAAAGVGPGDTVVAYCRTGGQASFLYAVARHLGYDVKLYDGSYVDWSRTAYPVER